MDKFFDTLAQDPRVQEASHLAEAITWLMWCAAALVIFAALIGFTIWLIHIGKVLRTPAYANVRPPQAPAKPIVWPKNVVEISTTYRPEPAE